MSNICTAYTKQHKRCTRIATCESGMCKQHDNIYGKIVMVKNNPAPILYASPNKKVECKLSKVIVSKQMEENKNLPKCSICLEPVHKNNDALFNCSHYKKENSGCAIHVKCAQKLRKLECPTCRGAVQVTPHIGASIIAKIAERQENDMKEHDEEANRAPSPATISDMFLNSEYDNEIWNEMVYFAIEHLSDYNSINTDSETAHEQIHNLIKDTYEVDDETTTNIILNATSIVISH